MEDQSKASTVATVGAVIGKFRWIICALLFFGSTKNYMDRQVLGVLKIDYGNLVFAFQLAYACGIVFMGRLMDRLGTRIGYAITMVFWSLASMGTALAGSLAGFMVARSALGLGESGVFPASIKAVAEWFPKKERAFATGIFNAGTNVGAVVTPLLVPWITIHFGWRYAFVITGAVGFVWLAFWLTMYRNPEEHPRLLKAELDYIRSDPQESVEQIKWLALIPHRQTWTFIMAKLMTDPIWWFYLFWAPDFLQRKFSLSIGQVAVPVMIIYIIADFGSVGGGWLPTLLIKRGASLNGGRKGAMLFCALCVLPVVFASSASAGLWVTVALVGLAAAAHQGFSANVFTLPSDMFPSRAVGSIVGIGGMAGAIGGMVIAKVVGGILQATGSYRIPFLIAGSAYLLALGVVQILSPRLEPAHLDT